MSPYSPFPGKATFALRLSLFYAALWLSVGIQLPFVPIWLVAQGLDSRSIGFLLAMPMLVRVAVIPVARAADRYDAVPQAILIACVASVAANLALALSCGPGAIFVTFALASAAFAPTIPLADAYALRGLREGGHTYGRVRLWGSASFILGNLGAGLLIDTVSARYLIWLIAAAMAATVGAAMQLATLPSNRRGRDDWQKSALLRREPALLLAIAAASFIQASHAVYYGFSTIEWRAAGLVGTTIAGLWALGVLSEIALFALAPRLRPTTMLAIGGAGAAIRWSVMALHPPLALLPVLQCLHALSFGATHLGVLGFLLRAAPAGLGATIQGYSVIAQGLLMAAAMGLSGVLYSGYGRGAYAVMALLAIVGGGFAYAARRLARLDGI